MDDRQLFCCDDDDDDDDDDYNYHPTWPVTSFDSYKVPSSVLDYDYAGNTKADPMAVYAPHSVLL